MNLRKKVDRNKYVFLQKFMTLSDLKKNQLSQRNSKILSASMPLTPIFR